MRQHFSLRGSACSEDCLQTLLNTLSLAQTARIELQGVESTTIRVGKYKINIGKGE